MGTEIKLKALVEKQRAYFMEGKTLSVETRLAALNRLEKAILANEEAISRALKEDLGKSPTESYMCETGMTLAELSYVKKHLRSWNRDRRVMTPMAQFHARSFTVREPYGVVLIMSPWNYPLQLALEPLIGALAAGNCCIVKPSAYSPATSAVIAKLLRESFPEEYVAVVEGGRQENQGLLAQKFDYIFFTGGVNVGKLVMEKASAHLTPVTLELGGKSPCIIDESANLKLAARRLVFGKYLNCGQTCVAPDYVLVHEKVKEEFLGLVKKEIVRMFGERPLENPDYGKIINRKHFERLLGLLNREKLIFGGESDPEALRIAPSILDNVTEEDAVMQEEIFGPILPVLTVRSMEEALSFVNARPKPLAFYVFTQDKKVEQLFLRRASFGGGCINDTVIHLATSAMGFGGVGSSGMGSYHGKKSFETFSHEKSIVKKYNWIDLPMRYQPYTQMKDKMIRMFLK